MHLTRAAESGCSQVFANIVFRFFPARKETSHHESSRNHDLGSNMLHPE
jgi:hypothetical protein